MAGEVTFKNLQFVFDLIENLFLQIKVLIYFVEVMSTPVYIC